MVLALALIPALRLALAPVLAPVLDPALVLRLVLVLALRLVLGPHLALRLVLDPHRTLARHGVLHRCGVLGPINPMSPHLGSLAYVLQIEVGGCPKIV